MEAGEKENIINSTSNRRMKEVSRLLARSKERREQGVFVAEGIRMFLETPPARLVSVYVSESFYAQEKNRELLKKRRIDFELVTDRVFESISDTVTPQGILFLVKIREITEDQLFDHRRMRKNETGETFTYLLLNAIQDPGNLGTMLRTAEGAGVSAIVCDRRTVDLYNPKVIRSTMGSVYRMPFLVSENLNRTVRRMKEEGIRVYAAAGKDSMPAGKDSAPAVSYDEADCGGDTAFLIGNEGNGIDAELLAEANQRVYIPMAGKVESLNASMAAGILMYEAARQKRRDPDKDGGTGK